MDKEDSRARSLIHIVDLMAPKTGKTTLEREEALIEPNRSIIGGH